MSAHAPVVVLLHGEDEYTITQFVADLLGKLGDPAMVSLYTTRLDGRSTTYAAIEAAVSALPFMVKQRLVILTHPLAQANNPTARQKFIKLLDRLPPSVLMVMIEDHLLTDNNDRNKNRLHWLERWAAEAGERAQNKPCPAPKGDEMIRRIQAQAKAAGGQITPKGAETLMSLVGESPVATAQEIQKLLAYVNYVRPIEVEDVQHLTTDQNPGDIFTMVDAIGSRNAKKALEMLHRQLTEQEPFMIYGMVVRQFRFLLVAREVLDSRGGEREIQEVLTAMEKKYIHPFVVKKISEQARRLTLPYLEDVYHRLLVVDEAVKRSEMDYELGLDTLISAICSGQN